MIIAKTKMTEIPKSCKECELVFNKFGVYLCPLLRTWIEDWEYKNGKVKLDSCPLEER